MGKKQRNKKANHPQARASNMMTANPSSTNSSSRTNNPLLPKSNKSAPSSSSSSSSSTSGGGPFPLNFPSHLQKPKGEFLRDTAPYQDSFREALRTAYEGFAFDKTVGKDETVLQAALETMQGKGIFRRDVTQPFGLGTKCAKTYVTRCVAGEPGTTYKYLGLRMFSYPWKNAAPEIASLKTEISKRTKIHLESLDRQRKQRGGHPVRGSSDYDICLINRMEASKDLKMEPSLGNERTCVSWHADSSLEHYSTIAVYHTLKPKSTRQQWSVAMRVALNSEGPASSRRGTDIESSIVAESPPIACSLPSGSTYYLLDDFNHHHQHAVLTSGEDESAGVRYSLTFRKLRMGHSADFILERCRTTCSQFHKKGTKLWRSEQLLLNEIESEWIRQFYIQGSGNYDLLWPYWKEPIQQLLIFWSRLESRTFQVIELLKHAAHGKCEKWDGGQSENNQVPSRAQRKAREKEKKALATVEDLVDRSGNEVEDAKQGIFQPFAELLEERARMRNLWVKREKDHVFREMPEDCRPMAVPFQFDTPGNQKLTGEVGISPLPGSSDDLKSLASNLESYGKAYLSKSAADLPEESSVVSNNQTQETKDVSGANTEHSKPIDWEGWSRNQFGLELQSPWAEAILDGTKSIETRLYPLPTALVGKRIMIIKTPSGIAGKSDMGNRIVFGSSSAKLIGWCIFSGCQKYTTNESFEKDESKHLVTPESGYGWKEGVTRAVFGWVVDKYGSSDPKAAGFNLGIRRMRSIFELKDQQSTNKQQKKRKDSKRCKHGQADSGKKKKKKRY